MSSLAPSEMPTPEAISEAVAALGEKIVAQLRTVFDPEIPVNIYDLGLIYAVDVKPLDDGDDAVAVARSAEQSRPRKFDVRIDMTLTTPNCPVAGEMPAMVHNAVMKLEDEINEAQVNLVWDPPWDRSRMSDEAMLHLNMF